MQEIILGKRYQILEKLGDGGMSVVYLGRDIILNRNVTIKILREQFASDEEFVRRFHREAQAVASLSHPNIVSLYDVGNQDDWHYLIMEYVEGRSLKDLIRERAPLSPKDAINISQQICDALSHAHDRGIIHRDIKPHNILVTNSGRIKVTDFGIARAASAATLTYSGNIVGSVHYISPEQAKGAASDEKSDIYSLGVVLFEMLTGALPFDGDSPIAVAIQHIQNEAPDPATINPAIPQSLSRVVAKALAKIPAHRYSSTLEMRWELQQVLDGAPVPQPIETPPTEDTTLVMPAIVTPIEKEEKPVKEKKKLRKVWWAAGGLALLLVIFFAYQAITNFMVVPEMKVPNVTGQSYQNAKAILESAGLMTEMNKIYHDKVPAGDVISQTPDAGVTVKKGRMITLLISNGPKLVSVPDVTNKSRKDAESQLQTSGLVAHFDEQYSDSVSEGLTFDQSPPSGQSVAEGTVINLKVSKGSKPQYVTMPDVRGLSFDDAKKQINSVGLKIGVISKKDSTEYQQGMIVSQDVEPSASIQQGSSVNLVVSNGPGPAAVQSAHVTIPLPNDGAEHQVRIMVIDTKGTHQEYNATHQSGEIVEKDIPYYGEGKIQVFVDDVLSFEEPVK